MKLINRQEQDYTRERSQDVQKVQRNLDPILHPFEKAKEYTRALNAAKLERVFAKPFLCAFPHDDSVTSLARSPARINSIVAGCANGDVRLWDVPAKRCLRRLVGHSSAVRGIAVSPDGNSAVTCSDDCTVRLWKVPFAPSSVGPVEEDDEPVLEFQGKHGFRCCDHHWRKDLFATGALSLPESFLCLCPLAVVHIYLHTPPSSHARLALIINVCMFPFRRGSKCGCMGP